MVTNTTLRRTDFEILLVLLNTDGSEYKGWYSAAPKRPGSGSFYYGKGGRLVKFFSIIPEEYTGKDVKLPSIHDEIGSSMGYSNIYGKYLKKLMEDGFK